MNGLMTDEAYIKVKGRPCWNLLALGEGKNGKRAYSGASVSPDKTKASWTGLLEALAIPGDGRELVVIQVRIDYEHGE